MARLSRDEVLACVLDRDDSDDVFGEQNGETEEVTLLSWVSNYYQEILSTIFQIL